MVDNKDILGDVVIEAIGFIHCAVVNSTETSMISDFVLV